MQKSYTTKMINRPEMKFYLVIDYTLPSTWPKSTQVEIQNNGGSLGLVIALKTHSCLSHLIKRESLTGREINLFFLKATWLLNYSKW